MAYVIKEWSLSPEEDPSHVTPLKENLPHLTHRKNTHPISPFRKIYRLELKIGTIDLKRNEPIPAEETKLPLHEMSKFYIN